jgi:hypothetical protein
LKSATRKKPVRKEVPPPPPMPESEKLKTTIL